MTGMKTTLFSTCDNIKLKLVVKRWFTSRVVDEWSILNNKYVDTRGLIDRKSCIWNKHDMGSYILFSDFHM